MDTKKTISIILICIGIFILLFALSVDIIGIGKSTRFGYKQILGIIVGAITTICGVIIYLKKQQIQNSTIPKNDNVKN